MQKLIEYRGFNILGKYEAEFVRSQLAPILKDCLVNHKTCKGGFVCGELSQVCSDSDKDFQVLQSGCLMITITLKVALRTW